jgi:excisionase family DNA binding protein
MRAELQRLKQTLESFHQTLEDLQSVLLEFEETVIGEEPRKRPKSREGLGLLSISEVCQELGMGKSWVFKRIKSGEIPSVRLGHNIKVKREDLEKYLEAQRYHPPEDKQPAGDQ